MGSAIQSYVAQTIKDKRIVIDVAKTAVASLGVMIVSIDIEAHQEALRLIILLWGMYPMHPEISRVA